MSGGYAELGGGDRRVGVAVGNHQVGLSVHQCRLDASEDLRGLRRMARRADSKIEIRLSQADVVHDLSRQERVVVLAGMDEDLFQAGLGKRLADRSGLGDLRTRSDDVGDGFHCRESDDAGPPLSNTFYGSRSREVIASHSGGQLVPEPTTSPRTRVSGLAVASAGRCATAFGSRRRADRGQIRESHEPTVAQRRLKLVFARSNRV